MKKFIKKVFDFISYLKDCRIDAYAAQMAFFTIMAIIPLFTIIISVINAVPVLKNAGIVSLSGYMPEEINTFVKEVFHDAEKNATTAISISIVVTLYTAAKSIQSMGNGLDSVYKIKRKRSWIVSRGIAMLDTLIYIIVILVMSFMIILGNKLQGVINEHIPALGQNLNNIMVSRFRYGFVFLFVSTMAFYKMLPSQKVYLKYQIPGSVIASFSISMLSYALAVYVDKFRGFSMYGSISSLILIMVWLYFTMYIILICGAVNLHFAKIMENRKEKKRKMK